jgi:hypothetical protein
MFLTQETKVPVAFAAVATRLDNLAGGGALKSASQAAYARGTAGLRRTGKLAVSPQLVLAEFGGLLLQAGAAVMALRREAPGPCGTRYPALAADITVSPGPGGETVLRLAGDYEPPPGAPDGKAVRRVASATARDFAGRLSDLVTGLGQETGQSS